MYAIAIDGQMAKYTPQTNSWSMCKPCPTKSRDDWQSAQAVVLPCNKIEVHWDKQKRVAVYDPKTNDWMAASRRKPKWKSFDQRLQPTLARTLAVVDGDVVGLLTTSGGDRSHEDWFEVSTAWFALAHP